MLSFIDIKVKAKKEEGNVGSYEISPLPRGYGHTLANSLRRIVLSGLEGAGITSVKVNGVTHEYSTIEGVKEDVFEILLNLKNIKFKMSSNEPVVCSLDVSGAKIVTAKDLKLAGGVEVANPDSHIATLTAKSASLSLEVTVEKGVGYREAAESDRSELGRIPLDANFSPVKKVSFDVTNARKGQRTDLDAVVIDIETDGSIGPREALLDSVKILQDFSGKVMVALGIPEFEVEEMAQKAATAQPEEGAVGGANDEVSSWKVEDLPISKRSKSGLLAGGFQTVGDLSKASASDLLNLPGFGNKSLNEIVDLLNQYGIELK